MRTLARSLLLLVIATLWSACASSNSSHPARHADSFGPGWEASVYGDYRVSAGRETNR